MLDIGTRCPIKREFHELMIAQHNHSGEFRSAAVRVKISNLKRKRNGYVK